MNKIWIIISREFFTRVTKKSFIILTILMPFLMAGVIFVPALLASIDDNELRKVVIVDNTGKYVALFNDNESFDFVSANKMDDSYKNEKSNTFAVINITDDLDKHPDAAAIYSTSEVPLELKSLFNKTISKEIENERILSYDIPNLKKIISESEAHYDVKTVKWDKDGNGNESSTEIAMIVGMVFTLLIYMFVLTYGGMVMQSVIEEKTNRIVEIIVSSVKPFQLMMGKIVGIAMVGLLQFLIWGVMLIIILAVAGSLFGISSISPDAVAGMPPIGTSSSVATDFLLPLMNINFVEILGMFLLYFVGGYLLYSSIYAAIGASVNEQEDTQQFMLPIVMLLVFALYAGIYSAQNPNGPLAFWCSLIPFTSPIVMMVRIPFEVPLWQEILSLVILYITAICIVWIAGRIYRVGILMYGKKPTFKEMIKWLKYK